MHKIVIVDSGLGGLVIHAMLYKKLMDDNIKNIELTYFNVQPKDGILFRHLNKAESITFFDEMLSHIMAYKPEQILMACNTLTALYPKTETSKHLKIPVLGMIDLGVQMIADYINLHKATATVSVILGTRITIKSNLHKEKLIAIGFSADRIVNQACWNLSDMIQKGAKDKATEMIRIYLSEAKEKIKGKPEHIVLVLCCTHFQMAKSMIQDIGQDIFKANIHILNPNEAMVQAVTIPSKKTGIEIINKCYSNPTLAKEEIETLNRVLSKKYPAICQALKDYKPLLEASKSLVKVK